MKQFIIEILVLLTYGENMDNLNYVFFEEYKHLDKLCEELYGEHNGISHYIDDMKNTPEYDSRNISYWRNDLEKLIRLRHIRNQLAHSEDAFNENICTQKDIEWCRNFYNRILNQSDSLALLYQYSKKKRQIVKTKTGTPQPSSQHNTDINRIENTSISSGRKTIWSYWTVLLLVIVGTLLLAILGITVLWG